MPAFPVVIVDDEPGLLRSASLALRSSGIAEVDTLEDGRQLLDHLEHRPASAVLLDLGMPHINGESLIPEVRARFPEIPIIIMTAVNDIDTAIRCMQKGASDYLVKPVEKSRLLAAVTSALESRRLRDELINVREHLLDDRLEHAEAFAEIVTRDPIMLGIFRYLEAIAGSSESLLITGETGTGKELVARASHALSRPEREFVAVNVAGLDDTMFSDTLFGHARGAFSGADRQRDGLMAAAGAGTLFLDEIGDLADASQVKLLRLLQDGTYFRLGEDRPRKGYARIVAATNHDLPALVESKQFRKDLFYRLRTHQVALPPLRARLNDLPDLVRHLVTAAAKKLRKPAPGVPDLLQQSLSRYRFPGNVRELESMLIDAVARSRDGELDLTSILDSMGGQESASESPPSLQPMMDASVTGDEHRLPTLKEAEDYLVGEAMRQSKGNQSAAARLLGLSRQALNKRLVRARKSDQE